MENRIELDIIGKLLETKKKSGFFGKITIYYRGGIVYNVEKSQDMNTQRIAREVRRDTNSFAAR